MFAEVCRLQTCLLVAAHTDYTKETQCAPLDFGLRRSGGKVGGSLQVSYFLLLAHGHVCLLLVFGPWKTEHCSVNCDRSRYRRLSSFSHKVHTLRESISGETPQAHTTSVSIGIAV